MIFLKQGASGARGPVGPKGVKGPSVSVGSFLTHFICISTNSKFYKSIKYRGLERVISRRDKNIIFPYLGSKR